MEIIIVTIAIMLLILMAVHPIISMYRYHSTTYEIFYLDEWRRVVSTEEVAGVVYVKYYSSPTFVSTTELHEKLLVKAARKRRSNGPPNKHLDDYISKSN